MTEFKIEQMRQWRRMYVRMWIASTIALSVIVWVLCLSAIAGFRAIMERKDGDGVFYGIVAAAALGYIVYLVPRIYRTWKDTRTTVAHVTHVLREHRHAT